MKLSAPGGGAVLIGPHLLLPADKARHVGEAVAMVVAQTLAQALDAAEAVKVDYQVLPGCSTRGGDGARRSRGVGRGAGQRPDRTWFGDRAATERAFAGADHVVAIDFHIARVTGVPLEPRAALGHYDAASERYTLYAGSGGAVRQKRELAAVLGIPAPSLRVLSHDVGGNFGTRNRVFVEFALVLWAARKLGRPVKYTASRSEAFLSDYQGRDLVSKVELALDKDGRFLAMRATNISNVGARCVSLSPLSKGAGLIPGSYDIAAASLRALAVFTNTMPTNAYRSSGRPEVTFAIERLIDEAAGRLGFDRIELRRRNSFGLRRCRTATGSACSTTAAATRRTWSGRWRSPTGRASGAPPRGGKARQAARPRACELRRILDRRAQRAGAHLRARARMVKARRRRDRHAAERAGARDKLRAGHLRPPACSGRARQDHHGRYRCGEGRRRLPFGPLHAPRGDFFRESAAELIGKGKQIAGWF